MRNHKKKIVFVFFVWGDQYVKRLSNYLLKNIELEIQENNKIFNKFDIKFKFYTTNQSSKDIENNFFQYKYINKFCNLEIKTFDNLSKNFDKKNKYKLLGSLQTLSFIDNILYDYMFFYIQISYLN